MRCGAGLPVAPASTSVERPVERKVITALFCGLVGCDRAGRATRPGGRRSPPALVPRPGAGRIESHGGVVEKFIGDAVVGVFGAPAAHEDDAIRAVRAALGIVGDVAGSGLDLQVRIGVHTGEALVRVGDDRTPEEGSRPATASTRRPASRTWRRSGASPSATRHTGLRCTASRTRTSARSSSRARRSRSGSGDLSTGARFDDAAAEAEATPFVGRDDELERLVGAVERSAASRAVQLVSVIAEPGMGKSPSTAKSPAA